MMKKIVLRKILCLLIVLFTTIALFNVKTLNASAPYKTRTVNRYDEIVETQDAYDPILNIKSFKVGESLETFNKPQDLFIDSDDYYYIADTDNKRIVVLDNEFKFVVMFGSDKLLSPRGIFVRDNNIYVADFGDKNNPETGRVYVYSFDKETKEVLLKNEFGRPESELLKIDKFLYRPMKIAVDSNNTMYIVSQGSSNGVLLVNQNNRFLNYFAPNSSSGTFADLVKNFIYGENEKVILTKNIAPAPENVYLNDSGYIYTVSTVKLSKNDLSDALKKVNVGGLNFYPVEMNGASSYVDTWASNHKTVYALTKSGYIYEYDIEGNLLFMFSGPIDTDEQLGLFKSASSIAVDSKDNLYVIDDSQSSIQVFRKTLFTSKVHNALELYMSGKYIESSSLWEDVLRYNSLFDLAHKGLGMAYYLEHDYKMAMEKFEIANAKEEYSEAFWEQRNLWIMNNIQYVIYSVVALALVIIVLKKTNRKYSYLDGVKNKIVKIKENDVISRILIMNKFLSKPLDAVYYVRHDKKIKLYNAFIVLLLLTVIYIFYLTSTGFLFTTVILEKTILLKEITKIVLPIVLFIISNYLVTSLMSGEGTLRCITINTLGSLMPIVVMMPFIIIVSNMITNNESFIYYFSLTVMFIWSIVLLFVVMKETHNFTAKQTLASFILTIFMMLIIIIVCILLYLVVSQVVSFFVDLFKEVVFRG